MPAQEQTDFERRRVRDLLRARLFDARSGPARLGRFEIVRRIGEGASSIVYEARDPELDRRVAIKLLRRVTRPGVDEAVMRERLLREGRALARVSHPHVLSVLETGSHGDDVFLAVELADGRDLAGWRAEEAPAPSEILRVMRAAGEGLAAAHALGLVHRDVKPANVLVDRGGRVRVADFGLVQAAGLALAGESVEASGARPALTHTGAHVGSPAYMAPEQWRGDSLDERTDQFGYCVTFFEALHGRRPFEGESLEALARAISSGRLLAPPDDGVVAPWLDEILRRGLAPDPDDRYPSMAALLGDLDRHAEAESQLEIAERAVAALDERSNAAAFEKHAARARVALDQALARVPGHAAAGALRDRLLVRWFEHDLRAGALESAAVRLAELGGARAGLDARLAEARAAARDRDRAAGALAALRFEEDPNVALRLKAVLLLAHAPLWCVASLAVGAADRAGLIDVGAGGLAIYFAAHTALHLGVSHAFPARFMPNRNARRMVQLFALNLGGSGAMLGLAHGLGVSAAVGLAFVQVMLATFWCGATLFVDRRALSIAAIAAGGAVAIWAWPAFAIEAYGLATAGALLLLGLRWLAEASRSHAEEATEARTSA